MTKYTITNAITGHCLGTFEADDEREALDVLARDAGYDDAIAGHVVCHEGTLCDYSTGEELRDATDDEYEASLRAADSDGGSGVITVDGRSCYVAGPEVGHVLTVVELSDLEARDA